MANLCRSFSVNAAFDRLWQLKDGVQINSTWQAKPAVVTAFKDFNTSLFSKSNFIYHEKLKEPNF